MEVLLPLFISEERIFYKGIQIQSCLEFLSSTEQSASVDKHYKNLSAAKYLPIYLIKASKFVPWLDIERLFESSLQRRAKLKERNHLV